MPISIRQIAERIRECGWTCDILKADDGHRLCHVSFRSEEYRNPEGEQGFDLIFTTEHDGKTMLATIEDVYQLESRAHLAATCETMLRVCDLTDFCQFELYDHGDEVRMDLVCELPVDDGTITAGQIAAVVSAMGRALDTFHEPLTCATERGVVDVDFFRSGDDEDEGSDGGDDDGDDSGDSSGGGLEATDSVDIDVPGVSDASQREMIEQAIREAGGVEELLRLIRRARRDERGGGR